MPNDDSRILTTHVGSLVRPQEIIDLMRAKEFAQVNMTGKNWPGESAAGLRRWSKGNWRKASISAATANTASSAFQPR